MILLPMKTLFLAASVAILAGASGLAWQATRDEQAAARSRERIAAEATRAHEAARRAESRLAQAGQAAGEWRARLEALRRSTTPGAVAARPAAEIAAPAASPGGNPVTPEAVAAKLADAREKTRDAKKEIEFFARQRMWLANAYQPLFTALRLSPEQSERFVAIGMKRAETMSDLEVLKEEKLFSGADSVAANYEAKIRADEDAAYRELLGPAGYQRFLEYNRTASAREIFSGLAAAGVLAGIPFPPAQLEQFVQTAANNFTRPPVERPVFHWWSDDLIDWAKADAQLRPLMSEAQWQLFETHAPGGTTERSRFKNKFDGVLEKARAAERAALVAQPAMPPGK